MNININKIRSDNSGFTLLEMIVAVLIIAIACGAMSVAAVGILNSNVDRAVKVMNSGITRGRTVAMSKVDGVVRVVIYHEGGKYYIGTEEGTVSGGAIVWPDEPYDPQVLCNDNVSISKVDGSTVTEIGEDSSVMLEFYKTDGSFKTAPDALRVSKGDRSTDLVLVADTGRTYTD